MRVLLTGLDEAVGTRLAALLGEHGFDVVPAPATEQACAELRLRDYDLVLSGSADDTGDLVRLAGPAAVGVVSDSRMSNEALHARGLAFFLETPLRGAHVLGKLASTLNLAPLTEGQRVSIDRYFACLERADWDGVAATCTENVLYHLPVDDPRFGRTVGGRRSFRDFAAETFGEFKEPSFVIESVRALPRGASVRYTGSWLGADGTRHTMPGAVLFVFEHELIREIGVRLDVAALHTA